MDVSRHWFFLRPLRFLHNLLSCISILVEFPSRLSGAEVKTRLQLNEQKEDQLCDVSGWKESRSADTINTENKSLSPFHPTKSLL